MVAALSCYSASCLWIGRPFAWRQLVECIWLSSVLIGNVHGQEILPEKQFASIKSPVICGADFTFDGGSVQLTLIDKESNQSFLLIVHPKSEIIVDERNGTTILWSTDSSFQRDIVAIETDSESFLRLIRELIGAEPKEHSRLHFAATSLLLAVRSDLTMVQWGAAAVDSLERGTWYTIFR